MKYSEFLEEKETPYKKKKKKSVKKSNHKHQYQECLIKWDNHYHAGERCFVCGKIGDLKFFETIPYREGISRLLTQEEILEKYKNLECFDYKTGEKIK